MITNQAPAKLVLFNPVAAYTLAYLQHSIYTDFDVYGKSFWLTENENTTRQDFTDVSKFFVVLNNLKPGTTYSIIGAFLDAMIDQELRDAQIGFNISDPMTFKTKVAPKITAAYSTSQAVEVGVGMPIVNIETTGEADYVSIEMKLTTDPDAVWELAYRGPLLPKIQFGGIPPGTYRVRIAGAIMLPDGLTVDSSGLSEYADNVVVEYAFTPPSAATNLQFKVAHVLDGKERYDLRVEWDWEKGDGANLREFALSYIDSATYAASGWTKAQVMNVSSSKKATIPSFPFKVGHKFKVTSTAWGPDDKDATDSIIADFIIDEDTPIDNSFINETGIDMNYAFIRGKLKDANDVWKQTFLIDAATGGVSIGLLDEDGKAPISFDPVQRIVNVDGKVITKQINAASFVMTNLTGNDNPAIYTQGKAYGDNNAGIWMGLDSKTLKPKLDIGNATQWIRYDGTTLVISSGVQIGTPNGNVPIETGIQGKRTVFIYILGTSLPAKPTSTSYPPAGWSTTPPNRTDMRQNIYATTGLLDPVTNKLLSGTSWADVFQFSGTEGTIGKDGGRGPGFYTTVAPVAQWTDSAANNFFTNNFNAPPTRFDVLTQYNGSNPSISYGTRQWNGSAWVAPALVVHGDMIATGTITSSRIVANDAFLAQIGVNIIYNRAAALSGNPEAVYTMKIDLANGYIHIR